jgi:hypothetical protein
MARQLPHRSQWAASANAEINSEFVKRGVRRFVRMLGQPKTI